MQVAENRIPLQEPRSFRRNNRHPRSVNASFSLSNPDIDRDPAIVKCRDARGDARLLPWANRLTGLCRRPDHSLKEAAPERDRETKARAAISRADRFIVML